MKLVLIIGSGAVGKMTVGKALMDKTGLRLFHNHMMIEPVIDIFGYYNSKVIARLRQVIFEEFVESDCKGMIFTYMWAFDQESDWNYVDALAKLFEEHDSEIYCVELVASQEIRLQRNQTEYRLSQKASKRDLEFSSDCIRQEDQKYRLVSHEGEVPFANYIKIDNTNLSPEKAANLIMERFGLE